LLEEYTTLNKSNIRINSMLKSYKISHDP